MTPNLYLRPVVGGWLEQSLREASKHVAMWPQWKRDLARLATEQAMRECPRHDGSVSQS